MRICCVGVDMDSVVCAGLFVHTYIRMYVCMYNTIDFLVPHL